MSSFSIIFVCLSLLVEVGIASTATGSAPSCSGSGSPTGASCLTVITSVASTTSTATSIVSTFTIASDAHLYNGDDLGIESPLKPSTFTSVDFVEATTDSTTTITTTLTPTSTTGTVHTVTIPASPGFLPVQSTLPRASYVRQLGGLGPFGKRDFAKRDAQVEARSPHAPVERQAYCNVTTSTQITTIITTSVSTSTQTLTGDVIVFPEEGTAFELSTFSNPKSTVYTTSTRTVPEFTSTSTVQANTTVTVPATTTTFYEACATNNFADAVGLTNGSTVPIRYIRQDEFPGDQGFGISPHDCCARSLSAGAAAWFWSTDHACFYTLPDAGNECGFNGTSVTAFYGTLKPDIDRVVGNSYCGVVDAAEPDPGLDDQDG